MTWTSFWLKVISVKLIYQKKRFTSLIKPDSTLNAVEKTCPKKANGH